ncbi:MAG: hypothetical protein ABJK20_07165, partial [Halieaceae bacterium]
RSLQVLRFFNPQVILSGTWKVVTILNGLECRSGAMNSFYSVNTGTGDPCWGIIGHFFAATPNM